VYCSSRSLLTGLIDYEDVVFLIGADPKITSRISTPKALRHFSQKTLVPAAFLVGRVSQVMGLTPREGYLARIRSAA
jgi:hypothetical protein